MNTTKPDSTFAAASAVSNNLQFINPSSQSKPQISKAVISSSNSKSNSQRQAQQPKLPQVLLHQNQQGTQPTKHTLTDTHSKSQNHPQVAISALPSTRLVSLSFFTDLENPFFSKYLQIEFRIMRFESEAGD
ncbi:hypothetical protein Droror1_Dr00027909 [Drosera rotundifolia]